MQFSIAQTLADAVKDGRIKPSEETLLYHVLMTAYGGLTPKRIREEFTTSEIVELLSLLREMPGPVGELTKIRTVLEGLVGAAGQLAHRFGSGPGRPGGGEVVRIGNDMTAEEAASILNNITQC